MAGQAVGAVEQTGKQRCSKRVSIHFRFMTHAKLPCGFGGAFFIAEQDHFGFGMDALPAFEWRCVE